MIAPRLKFHLYIARLNVVLETILPFLITILSIGGELRINIAGDAQGVQKVTRLVIEGRAEEVEGRVEEVEGRVEVIEGRVAEVVN
jgi:hypothetical protein